MKKAIILIFVLTIFMFNSCEKKSRSKLERESLFSIPLGKLADEIDYFQRDNLKFSPDNDLFMKGGFFYVSNGRSGKFMKFNSYGDILTLIYNSDRNPYPAELKSRESDNSEVNRSVISWPFNSPGAIAVLDEDIYIVDKVAQNRQIKEDYKLMDRNILHFNNQGKYINFIGLDGVGGQPFPYIENIWVSESSELIVLYRTRNLDDESWFANWYSVSGSLRYSVEIREKSIPMPAGEENLIISLDNIVPDRRNYELYLKMTYFRQNSDSSDGNSAIGEVFSGTLNFDVQKNLWHSWSRLPEHKISIDEMEIDSPYTLVGSFNEYMLFISLGADNTYNLLVKNSDGRFVHERSLELGEIDIIYKEFFLSDEGILNAMIFTEKEAKIMWWRTDKLLNSGKKDG